MVEIPDNNTASYKTFRNAVRDARLLNAGNVFVGKDRVVTDAIVFRGVAPSTLAGRETAARVFDTFPFPRLLALAFLGSRIWIVTIIPPLLTGPAATRDCLVSVALEAFEARGTLAMAAAVSCAALNVFCTGIMQIINLNLARKFFNINLVGERASTMIKAAAAVRALPGQFARGVAAAVPPAVGVTLSSRGTAACIRFVSFVCGKCIAGDCRDGVALRSRVAVFPQL